MGFKLTDVSVVPLRTVGEESIACICWPTLSKEKNTRIVISCLGTAGILGFMGSAWRAFCPPNGTCIRNVMLNSHTWFLLIAVFTCVAFCINLQVFSLNPKAMVHFQLLLRLVKSIALLVVLAGLVVAIAMTPLTVLDVLASILAYVPTGWGILSVSFMWQLWYHEILHFGNRAIVQNDTG